MECPFVVGQRVVCINKNWRTHYLGRDGVSRAVNVYAVAPQQGQIVKITALHDRAPCGHPYPMVVLDLAEFPGERYIHTGFRPLQERPREADTDIGVFTPLLNSTGPWSPKLVPKRENAHTGGRPRCES